MPHVSGVNDDLSAARSLAQQCGSGQSSKPSSAGSAPQQQQRRPHSHHFGSAQIRTNSHRLIRSDQRRSGQLRSAHKSYQLRGQVLYGSDAIADATSHSTRSLVHSSPGNLPRVRRAGHTLLVTRYASSVAAATCTSKSTDVKR